MMGLLRGGARAPPRLVRYLLVAMAFFGTVYWLGSWTPYTYQLPPPQPKTHHPRPASKPHIPRESKPAPQGQHTIDELVREAQGSFDDWLDKETFTVEDAAEAYRRRRGRHPPPGFDVWHKFATNHGAVIVEDFFDQIYHDLDPFWAFPPAYVRREAADFEMNITIRDGVATTTSDWFWTTLWLDMFKTIQHMLPDMIIALNPMDEPRLVVPWEKISKYVGAAEKTKWMAAPEIAIDGYSGYSGTTSMVKQVARERKYAVTKDWSNTSPYWKHARDGCPPDSASRRAGLVTSFSKTPQISTKYAEPHLRNGFVANYTLATDICHQPDLQALQGFFIRPLSVSTTKTMFPLFGGSKLGVNNEILLPAAMYWGDEDRFNGESGRKTPWDAKADQVMWRGVATGGKNDPWNWKGFQRHRFVSLSNGTKITRAETGVEEPINFAMPEAQYKLAAQEKSELGAWTKSWANVSFIDLMCLENTECDYTEQHFSLDEGVNMEDMFKSKYLPDIDGNSFSGRYRGFLRSTSLPIKSALFREWHDSRLLAWKHFVPMDTRYGDYHAIMEYFLGYPAGSKHKSSSSSSSSSGHGKEKAKGKGKTTSQKNEHTQGMEETHERRAIEKREEAPLPPPSSSPYQQQEQKKQKEQQSQQQKHQQHEEDQQQKKLVSGHDEVAERIAADGKMWAERVLRKEDMQIYTLRLLLEYARVSDDKRSNMGWVEDLKEANKKTH